MMRYPFSTKSWGKGLWHSFICCFNLGIFGCTHRHLWHRSSNFIKLSSSPQGVTLPVLFSSSITPSESRKKVVVKEFQCFLFFMQGESKSWLTICMWSCLIDGSWRRCMYVTLKFKSTNHMRIKSIGIPSRPRSFVILRGWLRSWRIQGV